MDIWAMNAVWTDGVCAAVTSGQMLESAKRFVSEGQVAVGRHAGPPQERVGDRMDGYWRGYGEGGEVRCLPGYLELDNGMRDYMNGGWVEAWIDEGMTKGRPPF